MIRKFFLYALSIPVGLILLVFAVSNRQIVALFYNPFTRDVSDPPLALPLFIIIVGSFVFGMIFGGVFVWWRQRSYRKDARRLDKESRYWHEEADYLRHKATSPSADEVTVDKTTSQQKALPSTSF